MTDKQQRDIAATTIEEIQTRLNRLIEDNVSLKAVKNRSAS
jgi:hypothetical protein